MTWSITREKYRDADGRYYVDAVCSGCGQTKRVRTCHMKAGKSASCKTCCNADFRPVLEVAREASIVAASGCWIWQRAKDANGYPFVWRANKMLRYHRAVLQEKLERPLREGECACHQCDTPSCVNPEHLFLGSQADNVRDMHDKGRASRGEKHAAIMRDVNRAQNVPRYRLLAALQDGATKLSDLAAASGQTSRLASSTLVKMARDGLCACTGYGLWAIRAGEVGKVLPKRAPKLAKTG